ncbi:MAG: hypothetical protein EZS28_038310, partial [Streblomastix strix]
MLKKPLILEPSEQGHFVNLDTSQFTTTIPTTTAVEQPNAGDETGKYLQSQLQQTLQDIERQPTPRRTVS